jgi:hypothetical protein
MPIGYTMAILNCTLLNFAHAGILSPIFENYSNDFEYTTNGVFRRIVPPNCPKCGHRMNHNGYNEHCKKGLGSVKIGRYVCPICEEPLEESRSFWEQLKTNFFDLTNSIYQRLRIQNVSYEGASAVMELIFPRGKDTIHNDFTNSVEKTYIPPVEYIQIVHYDEQHPKMGRTQKFRLTLLDGVTGRPIADELYDSKSPETIKTFLEAHLDPTIQTFVVTDLYSSYPRVFGEFFGENLIHQLCLLHLNKLIVGDFPKHGTIEQELMKYRMLNIFYNRDAEIGVLEGMAKEEQIMRLNGNVKYMAWLKSNISIFRQFVHERELKRRREDENLEQRPFFEAVKMFGMLMTGIDSFEAFVQKRMKMIEKNWKHLTEFYFVEDAPATNNLIENYYSTSLKTHRKKQLRTERGIANQMKLSAMKRAGVLGRCEKTLLEAFLMFVPFLDTG